ncbi:hypothetical protein [Nannocystis bainbridge]|uniref:Lipoprotein n=1 Tax=Nannocystis bainbridge TaxID=2995303 RepID=A0ABT5E5H0_9BACT|nr:hypothetical protein [Nannocystis bainbridge]MDC0721107.1 hypothetical protein [Nannocystis bainbridge]
MSRYVLALFLVPVLAACNPDGTCIHQFPDGGSTCGVEIKKNACPAPSTFFEENNEAGALRCRNMGYDTKLDDRGKTWMKSTPRPKSQEVQDMEAAEKQRIEALKNQPPPSP